MGKEKFVGDSNEIISREYTYGGAAMDYGFRNRNDLKNKIDKYFKEEGQSFQDEINKKREEKCGNISIDEN